MSNISGIDYLRGIDAQGPQIVESLRAISPVLADTLTDVLYGKVYQRGGITFRERLIASVAAAAAGGGMEGQVLYQSKLAMKNGVTFDDLMEVLLQVSVFCGFSRGINAMHVIERARRELVGEAGDDEASRGPSLRG
jgi:4-carboxymuconolactone decarboxylase